MADFDFDELDRAVSGALGGESSAASASTPVAPDSETQSAADSNIEETKPQQAESVEVDKSPSNPAIRRSSGRFMDVVHPSSDMRSRPATVGDAFVASHTAPPIEPNPIVNLPSEEPAEVASESAPGWQAPLESPFLPDAKVEKRPLGGSEPTGPSIGNEVIDRGLTEDSLEAELKLEASDEPLLEAHTMPDPIDFARSRTTQEEPSEDDQQTSEPSSDVEAVSFEVIPEASKEGETKEPELPLELTKEQEMSYHEAEPATSLVTPAAEPTGPTSITPQYKEQPSSTQPSGAIYDTEAYHQPLAHPAKKRSGTLVIIWVILLVALGAAAGAAFYLYVLPHL